MSSPFIAAICPTFARPQLLANAIACFLRQDYPIHRRQLLILDDAGQFTEAIERDGRCRWSMATPKDKGEWDVISEPDRYSSLPAKYNALLAKADFHYPQTDAFVVWEDDDVYFPHHLSAHAKALEHGEWSKPSRVLSTYPGYPDNEAAAGRFMASIAFSRALAERVGGWPITKRADFDQQFMSVLGDAAGPPVDTLDYSPNQIPGYCFRWRGSGSWHGQEFMRSPDDEQWYDLAAQNTGPIRPVSRLIPRLDADTIAVTREVMQPRTPA